MKKRNENRTCLYCEHATSINDPDTVLCDKKGPVENDYYCKSFSFDIFKLTPTPKKLPSFSPNEDYSDILK